MRLVRLFAPLVLALSVCTSSSLAWTADSFVGRPSNEVYSFEPPASKAPGLMSTAPSLSSDSKVLDLGTTLPSVSGSVYASSKHYLRGGGVGGIPSYQSDIWELKYGPLNLTSVWNGYNIVFLYNTVDYAVDFQNRDEYTRGLAFPTTNTARPPSSVDFDNNPAVVGKSTYPLSLSYDVSAFNASTCLFEGLVKVLVGFDGPFNGGWRIISATGLHVYIDGQLCRSYSSSPSGGIDLGGFLFSASKPIQNITLVYDVPFVGFVSNDASYNGTYTFMLRYADDVDMSGQISFLSGAPVLDGWNDQAQGDLNEHEKYESEWAGTMTDNFNKLDLSNFKFPVPLVSGFALISGIFTDIWNAMGEYRVVYVFPLTLAIVLLLVGRISKFGGSQSSSKKKGDGDA